MPVSVSATGANGTRYKRFKPLPQKTDWPVPHTLEQTVSNKVALCQLKPTATPESRFLLNYEAE
jgi:hypothetical protein